MASQHSDTATTPAESPPASAISPVKADVIKRSTKRSAAKAKRSSAAAPKAEPATKPERTASSRKPSSKSGAVLKLLRSPKGATIEALMQATSWQAHSVRGFLSASVKKKLGLALISEVGKDEVRRYRIDASANAG